MPEIKSGRDEFEKAWKAFQKASGFKILAFAGLSGRALSLVCYLINIELAGAGPLLTSRRELAYLLNLTPFDVDEALLRLSDRGIVRLSHRAEERFVLELVLDPSLWTGPMMVPKDGQRRLEVETTDTPDNLLPFFRGALGFPHEQGESLAPGGEQSQEGEEASLSSSSRGEMHSELLELYLRSHPDQDPEREAFYLESLVHAHPPDQVRRMIEAFGEELRSLGFLAGAWTHYAQKLSERESEESPPQLDELRARGHAADGELRRAARRYFEELASEERTLGSSERVLLHVLEEHSYPRRQLYWALRIRHRYPALKPFFEEVESLAQPPPVDFRRVVRNKSKPDSNGGEGSENPSPQ